MRQPLGHFRGLSLVDFLHLAVLVTDYRDVFLRQSCLLSELLLERQSLIHVVLLGLGLGLMRGQASRADLLSHGMVLLPNLLQLFLLLSLLELVSSELIDVILNHLLIEYFRLMYLLHELLDSCRIVQIPFTLFFFELRLLVSKLHEDALMVCSLSLNLSVQLLITGLELTNLLVGQIDCAEDVRLRSLRAACRGDCNSWHSFAPLGIDHIFACTTPYI